MAQVIWRKSDRIKVKIGKGTDAFTLVLSPLSKHEKMLVNQLMISGQTEKDVTKVINGVTQAIKFSVKDIEGVNDSEGNPYELSFDDDGTLSDESLDDLMNLPQHELITYVSSSFVSGVPEKFVNSEGEPLPDVELVKSKPKKKK